MTPVIIGMNAKLSYVLVYDDFICSIIDRETDSDVQLLVIIPFVRDGYFCVWKLLLVSINVTG
jgi:hypothetical protein